MENTENLSTTSLDNIAPSHVIEITDVYKDFKISHERINVLKGVNLKIKEGEFVVIFGPSGSGKSTTLHVMLGLEKPTSGFAKLLGLDLYGPKVDENKKCSLRKQYVGMIYQQPNWIKSINVIENVAFPLVLQGMDEKAAHKLALEKLELLGMQDWKNYRPNELSSGQQQKISLARALVNDPQVIIADEPTGNLDYKSSQDLMNILKDLSSKGKTVVMVTHEISNLDFADRVIQFLDGRIIGDIKTHGKDMNKVREDVINVIKNQEEFQPGENEESDTKKAEDPDHAEHIELDTLQSKLQTQPKVSLQQKLKNTLSDWGRYLLTSAEIFLLITAYYLLLFANKLISFIPNQFASVNNKIHGWLKFIETKIDRQEFGSISKLYLINLSARNLFAKRSRTIVTIGGVSIGISFIVFLLSIGFGAEQLVLNRVASLEELRQFESIPAVNTKVKIDDSTLSEIKQIDGVVDVLPLIGVAGRINFNNSSTDAVVYGAQAKYLVESAIRPVSGQVYDDNSLTNSFIREMQLEEALGSDLESSVPTDTDLENIEIVSDDTESADTEDSISDESLEIDENKVILQAKDRVAVVNTVFLEFLNIAPEDAIDQRFGSEFVVTGNLLEDNQRIETNSVEYRIVGVIEEGETPLIYVPITDIREIGVNRYSLMKVVTVGQDQLDRIRRIVELSGYRTTSVLDTVVQIEALFDNFRVFLIVLGSIALAVASLGMFNTLTVSLLERTREVGLMKSIGMKVHEVRDLFISESINMGFLGGIAGLIFGFIFGKLISLILSIIALTRGFDPVDVTYLPSGLILIIVILSAVIGMLTGFYPAYRTTKISALNALRYE